MRERQLLKEHVQNVKSLTLLKVKIKIFEVSPSPILTSQIYHWILTTGSSTKSNRTHNFRKIIFAYLHECAGMCRDRVHHFCDIITLELYRPLILGPFLLIFNTEIMWGFFLKFPGSFLSNKFLLFR